MEEIDEYDLILKNGLIMIFSQLPENSILAVDCPDFNNFSTFEQLEKFRIESDFNEDAVFPDYYYLFKKEYLPLYIFIITDSDLIAFLCHYAIFVDNNKTRELLLLVYDSCIFSHSNRIIIEDDFKRQAYDKHIYFQNLR